MSRVAEQMAPRLRHLDFLKSGKRPAVEHQTALLPSRRSHVNNPIRAANHVQLMLDYEQRIARGFQGLVN